MTATPPVPPRRVSYTALARLFLRMSLVAFGGPVAHVAMGEDEIVTRRGWLSREHYLDLIAAVNLIPGPNSTEVMIHVGYVLRGIPGAILSGFCFIFPAFLLTLALAVIYVATGALPAVEAALWGIKPVIVAIILVAGYRLAPTALKTRLHLLMFAAALISIVALDIPEVIVMLATGVIYALIAARLNPNILALFAIVPVPLIVQAAAAAGEAVRAGALDLFWYFLKIGSVLFGTGYVLFAYIQGDLVNTFGWLTSTQLLDAIAIGQFTPGPVSTTAAVVGYLVDGVPGAVAATIGIFLPSFVLVILTAPLIPRMRRSPFLSAFLSGINVGVIAAILVTVVNLAMEALRPLGALDGSAAGGTFDLSSGVAVALAVGSMAALLRWRVNATLLILIGAGVGLALR
ncbi:MAG: chromate efflux transporter [Anaerolineae bacterium]|nr:chromate efflux transporter [Anaerolineae bacterium]NUQ04389.1 chromate efflux transporter [Anaerolineae bacterium]